MSKPADQTSRQQKKVYRTPTLRTFGNVQQITQTKPGGSPVSDGAKVDFKKTALGAVAS